MNKEIFNAIINTSDGEIDLLIASPPCQGMSMAGKSRNPSKMIKDERNYLIYKVVDTIILKSPKYVLIENVPLLLKLKLPLKSEIYNILDIFTKLFKDQYNIEADIINAADYGVPQIRKRSIVRLYKKGLSWELPSFVKNHLFVEDAIGDLPSLEAGENSNINWHFARNHTKEHVICMKNTPTGLSAFENKKYYPKKKNGKKIKGYNTTYRRMEWRKPAPTITIRNDAISSQRNVHPGRLLADGTYSDARVLTPLELMRLSSIPDNWKISKDTNETLIRQCIGECIPPLMVNNILSGIV